VTGRFRLAVLPTPLVPASRLTHALGCGELWLKRDDLTGFVVAGNKARKLERLVAAALTAGADTLVTGGGPASNFCAAAAAAARAAGMHCLLVLYGDSAAADHANLALAQWHGAEVRFTGDPDRSSVDTALEQVAAEVRTSGGRPYVVPRGGASIHGAAAYADAGAELADQLDASSVRPATVLVAAGSGGTAAGLVADAAAAGRPWRVVAASVSRPADETAARVLRLARGVATMLGLRPAAESDIDIRDVRGPGYGIPSDEGERATRLAAETEGLLLDPVFTAKALGLLMTAPELPGPVVFWHTGGQVAALSHLAGLERAAIAT
jgi:1-aminocyclopropane-1-carboxylate deaminase/D-cysteine desulfhydrase-like pyridoxal-dependent ACC family enzyme